jgi:small conductance mechanosensitive channel
MGPPDLQTLIPDTCGDDPSWVCRQILEATDGNEFLATTADFLIAKPFQILLIVVIAYIANRLIRRAIRRFAERVAEGRATTTVRKMRERAPSLLVATGPVNLRSAARATTIAYVLRSVATTMVYGIALLLILGELGIDLAPLLAGAGIAGVAIGFGAQSLVKDFLSGLFMLLEDQYGVGDIVDLGDADGVVEAVTLRSTRLRDVNGTVWHVPNGEIRRVGNKSQQWARALLDIAVAYGTDVARAEEVIKTTADDLFREPAWSRVILEMPEVWGVERLGADGIEIRLVVKTKPSEQFQVMRELRRRLKDAFDAAGIEIPFPQRTLWIRSDDAEPPADPASGGSEKAATRRAAPAKKRAPRAAT